MWRDFKSFLIKQNALALAIAVVIGMALTRVVTALVEGVIMPIVAVAAPEGAWRTATLDVGPFHFLFGELLAALLNFLIVGLVAWRLSRIFIKPDVDAPTRTCAACRMSIDASATRCPHCTSQVAPAA